MSCPSGTYRCIPPFEFPISTSSTADYSWVSNRILICLEQLHTTFLIWIVPVTLVLQFLYCSARPSSPWTKGRDVWSAQQLQLPRFLKREIGPLGRAGWTGDPLQRQRPAPETGADCLRVWSKAKRRAGGGRRSARDRLHACPASIWRSVAHLSMLLLY